MINRREANDLGLNIEKFTASLYSFLRKLRKSYSEQLKLQQPYDIYAVRLQAELNQESEYQYTRAIIESRQFGAHHFVTEGTIFAETIAHESDQPNLQQTVIHDRRKFEGWRKIV